MFRITAEEIKKAQHLRRCVPLNVLTQGSSLRSPTLGYQKRNPYGVRQFANILCAALPFEMAIKSGTPMGFFSLMKNYLFAPTLPFEMAIKSGRRWDSSSSLILQTSSACVPPLLGEGLGVRL